MLKVLVYHVYEGLSCHGKHKIEITTESKRLFPSSKKKRREPIYVSYARAVLRVNMMRVAK